MLVVGPVFNQVIDYGGVSKRGDITEIIHLVGSNFTQDAAHDFTGPGFWQGL